MKALTRTDYNFPGQTSVYHGKVRDVYSISDDLLVMVATDRISAFDVILPEGIPYKGQVLNQIAAFMLDSTADIVPNWKLATPDPMVTVGYRCEGFKVEMIIRGYLTGSAWREYAAGNRTLCGVTLPEGMRENERFPQPIITPSENIRFAKSSQLVPSTVMWIPACLTCSAAASATACRTESPLGYKTVNAAASPSFSTMPSPSVSAQPASARSFLAYATSVLIPTSG